MKFLISIVGPTSVGKTDISIFLAKKLKTEIISCDSRKFYNELVIGSSRPLEKDLKIINHHFIGNKNIYDFYTAGEFEKDAIKKIEELFLKYNIVIMVGGSGLYEKAVIEGLDFIPKVPQNILEKWNLLFIKKGISFLQEELKKNDYSYYLNIDIYNHRRIIRALSVIDLTKKKYSNFLNKKKRNFYTLKIGLILKREILYYNINKRTDLMIKMGFLQEARNLYCYKSLNSLNTLGYKEIFNFFENKYSFLEMIKEIKKKTRHYAKRQITWYKKYSDIFWFNPKNKYIILQFIKEKINLLR